MVTKTDNGHLIAKLDLRRHFLRTYHANDPTHVLDCCQGSGVIWSHLRREFAVASYWGVDLKPKKGRLKIDSVRILQQPGWTQNVIDADTYGSPWKHWAALLLNLSRPTTVFLTIGQVATGTVGSLDKKCYEAAGMIFPTLKVPAGFGVKLAAVLTEFVLMKIPPSVRMVEAIEAEAEGNARYIGVRIEPAHKKGQRVKEEDVLSAVKDVFEDFRAMIFTSGLDDELMGVGCRRQEFDHP